MLKNFTSNFIVSCYFLVSIYFMEVLFRFTTTQSYQLLDMILTFVFLATFVWLIYFILSFLKGKWKIALASILLGAIAFIYASQFVYYQFFKTFYSMYSVGETRQIIEFATDIGKYLLANLHWILLFFAPVLLLLIFGRRYLLAAKLNKVGKIALVCCFALTQLIGIGLVNMTNKKQFSAYNLYYLENSPLLSVQRLGLLTTMRLDLQRQLVGWSPTLEAPPIELDPDQDSEDNNNNNNTNESQSEDNKSNSKDKKEAYNVMEIDFDSLIEAEDDPDLTQMHHYFSTIEPTKKNDYTGLYKGYNLILLTAESFSPFAVDQELTPTLYKMIHEGYHFTNFYTPIWEVSTSDGEYVALNSLVPTSGVWSFKQSSTNLLPFSLGHQLKKKGYETRAYHNHSYTYYGRDTSHPNLGYDYKGLGNGLEVKETWPESDLEMMEKTVPEYIDSEPFHTYYMTVSGHMQYSFEGNYMAWKNQKYVADLELSEQAKAYIAANLELEFALAYLLDALNEAGIAERTLIALSADHYPYGLEQETIDEFAGHHVEENFELYENSFILYTAGMEPETITKPASSFDILPTLSNLMGLDYDSRLVMGKDIFSDSKPLIPFLNKSFITEKGSYNSITEEFTPFDNEEPTDQELEALINDVQAKFYYSTKILTTDYYRILFD